MTRLKITEKNIFRWICAIVTFCMVLLILWKHSQYLLYHEQNQLFLFTGDYFLRNISIPGGLADYVSEFVVQFYYVPIYGALLTAALLTLSQAFMGMALRRCSLPDAAFAISGIPSLLFLSAMSDENVLLSYAVAMTFTTLFLFISSFTRNVPTLPCTILLFIGFAVLYWLAGPLAFTFIVAAGIIKRSPKAIAISIVTAFVFVWAIHSAFFQQYPLSRMLLGLNYYRVPEIYPGILFAIAAVIAAVPLITLIKNVENKTANYVSTVVLQILMIIYVPLSFDKSKSDILAYDSLVRQQRWTDIIEKAKADNPTDNFSLQAVNLALGMTGQLPESMFRFNQKGLESLIGKSRLDNTTQLITAEALFNLGLSNIAFSTTFDLQEAIMNDRKSGRLMKRMAECMIINGNYKVAAKYIGFLRNTLFYSGWARSAEKLLGNDNAVEAHPVYGPLRRNSFSREGFYDHTQLHKILALLALEGDGSNRLAWQYFCAATMLNGDLATLISGFNSYSAKFGNMPIPRHIQEAIAMYWTFSHSSFDGLPIP